MKKLCTTMLLAALLAACLLQPVTAQPAQVEARSIAYPGSEYVEITRYNGGEAETYTSDTGVIPYWSYLSSYICGLTVSGTTANVGCSATANSTSNKVSLTATLQKQSGSSYSTYTSWSASSTWICDLTKSTTVTSGTYRVKLVINIYNSSNTLLETVTVYSNTATC